MQLTLLFVARRIIAVALRRAAKLALQDRRKQRVMQPLIQRKVEGAGDFHCLPTKLI